MSKWQSPKEVTNDLASEFVRGFTRVYADRRCVDCGTFHKIREVPHFCPACGSHRTDAVEPE